MFDFFINQYLQHNLRREIKELYTAVAVKDFAFSMIAIFEPVYLYKLYGSLSIVFLYYAISSTIYFFLIPLGARAAAKHGFEHCIFYSIPFAILYFLTLSQVPNYWWLIFFALIFSVGYKSLFWPSYHTDFAHYSKDGYKGRELGTLSFISTMAAIVGPVMGGIILTKFGFEVLFVIVSIVSLISVVPLFATREKFIPHNFSYKKAFRRFLNPYSRYKRNDSLAYFGYGEEMISAIGWSIFIFLVVKEFYIMGIIASIVAVSIAIMALYVGKLADTLTNKNKNKLLSSSAILLSISWFLRPFATNWLGVLLVDIFSKCPKTGITYPLHTFVYSGGGDSHKGFLKYIVFYEMSMNISKALAMWVVFVISLFLSGFSFWFAIFSLGGFWSLLFLFKSSKS